MGALDGQPSEYALSRLSWVKCVLLLQSLLCLARLVVFLDILGSYMMGFMLVLGYLGIREDIRVDLLCAWGMVCLMIGTQDLVLFIHSLVNPNFQLSSPQSSTDATIQIVVFLSMVGVTLLGVPLAWWLFQDWVAREPPPRRGHRGQRRARLDHAGVDELRYTEHSGIADVAVPFTAFIGQARRLS